MGIPNRRMIVKSELVVLPEVRTERASLEELKDDSIEYLELLRYAQERGGDPGQPRMDHVVAQTATTTAANRSGPAKNFLQRLATAQSIGGAATNVSEVVEGSDHVTLSPSTTKVLNPCHGGLPIEISPHVIRARTKKLTKKRIGPAAQGEIITHVSNTPKRIAFEDTTSQRIGESIHLHHYVETGRWGAWVRVPCGNKSDRIFLGTHLTEYLAARCQDRAILMYESAGIKTMDLNFKREDYAEDEGLRSILTPKEFRKLLQLESRPKYTKLEATPCLRKFLGDELARNNISKIDHERANSKPLEKHFEEMLLQARKLNKKSLEYINLLQRLLSNTLVMPKVKRSQSIHQAPFPKWGTKRPRWQGLQPDV